jgi:MFS family permease
MGGALVAISGPSLVFAVNAATFAISGALIALTPGVFGGHQQHHPAGEAHATRQLFAGFRLIISNSRLAPLAAASALAYAAFGAALVIDPALSRYFHAGSVGYGLLTTVWGAGAVVGALVAGRVVTVRRAHKAVVWGMAAMALSLGSIVFLPTFALIVAAGAIGGVGSGFVFIPWLLLIQHHSTDAVRGRVVAAAEAFDQIFFLAGMGAAVPVISMTNPHHAYALAGILLTAATLITAVSSPRRPAVQPATAFISAGDH